MIPNQLPAWLVHDRLKAVMPIFQSIAKDKVTTMGHIQRGHLESTTVAIPSSEQIDHLDARLGPLWDRLLMAEREIHTLAALRDALLPELLSGRLRVPEAGAAAELALVRQSTARALRSMTTAPDEDDAAERAEFWRPTQLTRRLPSTPDALDEDPVWEMALRDGLGDD